MKQQFLSAIIALMVMTFGLYAQEKDTAQVAPKVELELIWEKKIPTTISDDWPYPGDIVFLDENGYNVFSTQCKDPERALKEKRVLMISGGKITWSEGDELRVVKEVPVGEGSSPNGSVAVFSKNGRNIAIIDGLYRPDPLKDGDEYKGGFRDQPATLRLFNWKGEELARTQFSPKGWEYIHLYPLGNDQTLVVGFSGDEGLSYGVKIFVKKGNELTEVFSNAAGSWFVDYAENGECVLLVIENKEMALFNGLGKEERRYICPRPFRKGFLSPSGDYIAEITAGKYVMIFDRDGQLINEVKVQGRGDYYAAFSPDEKFLCVTPGPWRVYLFETKNGTLLWEYVDANKERHFSSLIVLPNKLVFAGCSEAVLEPGAFEGTIEELNRRVVENATKDRYVHVLGNGGIIERLGPFAGEGFHTQLQAPTMKVSSDARFMFVQVPSRIFLYTVVTGGGQ